MPEYEFNLKIADVIAQSLHEAGFDKTVRLVTSGTRMAGLFEHAASANHLKADLFISIHHDSVPDNLKETWQYEGKKLSYSPRVSGYAVFVPMTMQIAPRAWRSATRSVKNCRSTAYTTPRTTRSADGTIPPRTSRRGSGVYRYDGVSASQAIIRMRALARCGRGR